ncbi:hypothetical protein ElyMa_003951300, partial [Elysia marginata]
MAPSYANLFMGALEGKMLNSSPHQPLIWLRYIDDIFLIWTHGSSTLDQFLTHANNFHPTIKFTSEISPLKIPFLDIELAINKARGTPRPQALQRRKKGATGTQRIPFVVTYNPALPNIYNILKTYLPILYLSDRCKKAIPELPMTAFRRPTNIRDIL